MVNDRPPLAALESHGAFIARHIGPSPDEQQAMLDAIGFASRTALIARRRSGGSSSR